MEYVSSHKESYTLVLIQVFFIFLLYFDEEQESPQFLAEVNSNRHKTLGKTDESVESLLIRS